ncbi:VanW family protein [Sporomusa sp.]|uniref:VanW family protein n=1 Tax=Sporomusa sp. TaxID=2078658 RepID=UPI002D7E7421|nr:VanW family protein [Sporomusa sp.]
MAEGVHIEGQAVGGLSAQEAGKILTTLASAKDVSAVNAGFNPVTGSVIPERPGQRIEISATLNELLAAQAGSIVTPVYQSFLPEITRDVLARSHLIGTFTTPILDKSPGRLTNIRLTAKLVNNTLIAPGQEFSFNQVTGEPTEARGFQPAIIFGDRGEEEQGLGGGMCQVSSTIYNAALAGELSVTERHPHSRPVAYVPPGKDAATYTDKDLRFINTTRWRLLTRVFIHDESSQLTVDLWALPDA